MRTIEPLGNEEEILREAISNRPQISSEEQAPMVAMSNDSFSVPSPSAPAPSSEGSMSPRQPRRNKWLLILAIATILANCFLILQLLIMPSDTSMMLAGNTIFALPVPGDPKALSHPADYLTLGLAVIQVILACFIVKFKWARIAIAYVALAMLCLSGRALALTIAMPEGEMLGMLLNPFALIFVALYGGIHIIHELIASFLVPIALIITAIVTAILDWRKAKAYSGHERISQSELSV